MEELSDGQKSLIEGMSRLGLSAETIMKVEKEIRREDKQIAHFEGE